MKNLTKNILNSKQKREQFAEIVNDKQATDNDYITIGNEEKTQKQETNLVDSNITNTTHILTKHLSNQ